jgi:SAM-dependent methyltransferase
MHWRVRGWPSSGLLYAYRLLPREGKVLDVGCLGCQQARIAKHLGLTRLKHFGVDWGPPQDLPEGFVYRQADLNTQPVPFEDDQFDFVVVSHIIEHLHDPVKFFADCMRVCKPGGIVYFKAPSERSLWLRGNPFFEQCFALSFFDDPTHVFRAWTPQSFYRLAQCYGCEVVRAGRLYSWIHRLLSPVTIPFCLLTKHPLLETCIWQTIGWASYLIARKPAGVRGTPEFRYFHPERPFKIKVRPLVDPEN